MEKQLIGADRLEEAWRSLGEVIRRREAELSALKKEFEILDKARALVLLRTNASSDLPVLISEPKRSLGLKEGILECLSDAEFGMNSSEIARKIANRLEESYANERSLHASVQTTLRRMVERKEVLFEMTNKGSTYSIIGRGIKDLGQGEDGQAEHEPHQAD